MEGATVATRSLADYGRLLSRQKWLILAVTATTFAVAVVFALHQPKVFRGSAQVLLNRRDLAAAVTGGGVDPSLSEDPTRYATTQSALARSSAVAAAALKSVGEAKRPVGDFLVHSSVTADPTADLLVFKVDAGDSITAARLANAYASAYAAYKLSTDTQSIQAARSELDGRIAGLKAKGDQTSALYRDLVRSEQQLHTMQLLQSPSTVLQNRGSGVQIKPDLRRSAMLALGFGLLLGIALAFLGDALDKRMKDQGDIERTLGLPLLARVPAPSSAVLDRGALTMLSEPASAHAEAIRRLATNMEFASVGRPSKVVMVTSSVPREGKSTTIGDLAVALALTGKSVVLVDLDLRRPTIAKLFGISTTAGLTNVMIGRSTLDEALVQVRAEAPNLRRPGAPPLAILPSGPLPPSPSEFLANHLLGSRVIEPLRKRFDYVLIDAPPMGVVSDAAKLIPHVDALLVIARLNVVERDALLDFKRELSRSPGHAIGFVLTGVAEPPQYIGSGYFDVPRGDVREMAGAHVPAAGTEAPGARQTGSGTPRRSRS